VFSSFRTAVRAAVMAAALGSAAPAAAQSVTAPQANTAQGQDPQAALRAEVTQLRQLLEAMQQRIAALEAAGRPAPGAPVTEPAAAPPVTPPGAGAPPTLPAALPQTAEPPAGAAAAGGQGGALPVYGNTSAMSKIFNPDMAVIGNFIGAAGRNSVEPVPALNLNEAELSLQAIVDPYARADFFLAASPAGLEIEEGFITFPTLPGGLLMKVGKMKAQFGKVNTMHSHVLPWADAPLPMRNLLGGEEGLNDSGVSVSKLILNPVLFLEATGEIYNGNNDLFTSHKRGNLSYLGRLRGYRDISEGVNLDVGTSWVYGHNDAGRDTATQVFGVDATLRYRPLRRAIYRRFLGRTELFWSRREADLPQENITTAKAFGAYVSGEYQFARRWFAGARYDFSDRAIDASLRDKSGSFLLTYWPSEFSQIRGQYRRTSYAEGVNANEVLFQFLFSIGAHGAHVF
jgi:hypothetical protein